VASPGERRRSQVRVTYLGLPLSAGHARAGYTSALLPVVAGAVAVPLAPPSLLCRGIREAIRRVVVLHGRLEASRNTNVGFELAGRAL
jgi:hypothetical protein